MTPTDKRAALAIRVSRSLQSAEADVSRLSRTSMQLRLASIGSSALSTLIAAVTSAYGPVVGEGIEGWRMACIAVAIFSFLATAATSMKEQLQVEGRLAETRRCIGNLRALDTMIVTESRAWPDVMAEFEATVRAFPEIVT